MGTFYNPSIVTDGLVLCLDAANTRSYPGSGTTWNDLSGNGHNGTLLNGPTLSLDGINCFVFDASNDYVNLGSISLTGSISVIAWIKLNAGATFQHIVDSSDNSWHLAISNTNRPYLWNGTTWSNSGTQLSYNRWYMIAGTYDTTTLSYYVDDSLSYSLSHSDSITTNNVNIGRWQSGGRYLNGKIGNVFIYNRALSADELARNFNATRGRYGI